MSKQRSEASRALGPVGPDNSVTRTSLAALLVVGGLAYVLFYTQFVIADQTPAWSARLGDWNFLIGFGALFLGLMIAANPGTPLGRGQGVVIGMLGCFLVGLVWIITYYVTSQNLSLPVIEDLGNYNLLVGIGFMATGFVYATRWE